MDGHIKDLWHSGKGTERVRTARYGKGKRWQVRWSDLAGNRKTQVFTSQDEAKAFLQQINVKKMRGSYIDPKAGNITLTEYAEASWLPSRVGDEGTIIQTKLQWRLHIKPYLGKHALVALRATDIRPWLKQLEDKGLSLTTQRLIRANLSSMLSSAVDDELIIKNPLTLKSTKLDAIKRPRIEPLSIETVLGIHDAMEERYAILALLGAFLGLRQGEAFGLAVEDVDFLRGVVHVRQQVKHVHPVMIFALPKFKKQRDVPLPEELGLLLSEYIAKFPPVPVTLPWERTNGDPRTFNLLVTTREKKAINRNYFNKAHWRSATEKVGLGPERANGFHGLRHAYASLFLGKGGSIRDLADYLGHADPGFTLKVYTHLMQENTERMKKVLGEALGASLSSRSDSQR